MPSTTKQSLEELINRVERAGWEVVDLGMRYRVTNPQGGGPMFVNKRPPNGNTLKPILDELALRGWNEYEQAERDEQDRLARLRADRERNEAKLRAAHERAAEIAARAAELDARNKAAAPTLGPNATKFGTYRKEFIPDLDGDFATALLAHNAYFEPNRAATAPIGRTNRPFDRKYAEHLKGMILRGEWTVSHQGLALDVDGYLLDGQHRLVALMWAAEEDPTVTIPTEITYDLPVEAMNVVDSGKRRSDTDLLALHGYRNRLVLSAAAKLLYKFDHVDPNDWYGVRLSRRQLLDVIDGAPGLEDAVARGQLLSQWVTPSAAAAFIYIAERVYRGAPMEDFLHAIRTGYDTDGQGLDEGDPRAAFRTFVERKKLRRRVRISNEDYLAMLLKAWNYWMTGEDLKQMRFRADERFPRPVERA